MIGFSLLCRKLLMRWTVLSSDALVFLPAVFYFIVAYNIFRPGNLRSNLAWLTAMILLNPCLIIIDHGHFQVCTKIFLSFFVMLWFLCGLKEINYYLPLFQYNCISLGLTVGAVAAALTSKDLLACALFSLAMNHKQVSCPSEKPNRCNVSCLFQLCMIWLLLLVTQLNLGLIWRHSKVRNTNSLSFSLLVIMWNQFRNLFFWFDLDIAENIILYLGVLG